MQGKHICLFNEAQSRHPIQTVSFSGIEEFDMKIRLVNMGKSEIVFSM